MGQSSSDGLGFFPQEGEYFAGTLPRCLGPPKQCRCWCSGQWQPELYLKAASNSVRVMGCRFPEAKPVLSAWVHIPWTVEIQSLAGYLHCKLLLLWTEAFFMHCSSQSLCVTFFNSWVKLCTLTPGLLSQLLLTRFWQCKQTITTSSAFPRLLLCSANLASLEQAAVQHSNHAF